jgi:hypothetical protein
VRYLRCPVDHIPSIPELQLLVPQSGSTARGPQPAPVPSSRSATRPREPVPGSAPRRAERPTLWQDSSFFQDSFFGPDTRSDDFGSSQLSPISAPAPLASSPIPTPTPSPSPYHASRTPTTHGMASDPHDPFRDPLAEGSPDDIAGIVVDSPKYSTRH